MHQFDKHANSCDDSHRLLWLGIRQGLLLALRAIEVYLQLEPSRKTKREKEAA